MIKPTVNIRNLERGKEAFDNAVILMDQGNFSKAEPMLEKANNLVPDRFSILNNLALTKMNLLKFDIAQDHANKALSIEPNNRATLTILQTLFSSDRNNAALTAPFLQYVESNKAQSKPQLHQDLLVDYLLEGEPGVFVEFGGSDGVNLSNSYYLEFVRGWSGIIAEPARQWHRALAANRPNAILDYRCVWKTSGDRLLFIDSQIGELSTITGYGEDDANNSDRLAAYEKYHVDTISLNDLLLQLPNGPVIDYLSIDTEGSEFNILSSFDLSRASPKVISVEHNYTAQRENIEKLIMPHGYQHILREYSQYDDWYVRNDIVKNQLENMGI